MPITYKNRIHSKHGNKHGNKRGKYSKHDKTKAGFVSASARAMLESIEAIAANNFLHTLQAIHNIYPRLILKARQYADFTNSVVTSYEYRRKNIPHAMLTILSEISIVSRRVNHLIKCHDEHGILQDELERNGVNDMQAFIILTRRNIDDLDQQMRVYTQDALDDYRGAEMGIETRPTMRNSTTRRTDAIVRPHRVIRTQALTRRIRSI